MTEYGPSRPKYDFKTKLIFAKFFLVSLGSAALALKMGSPDFIGVRAIPTDVTDSIELTHGLANGYTITGFTGVSVASLGESIRRLAKGNTSPKVGDNVANTRKIGAWTLAVGLALMGAGFIPNIYEAARAVIIKDAGCPYDYSPGETTDDNAKIQEDLKTVGYDIAVDGSAGQQTQTIVRDYALDVGRNDWDTIVCEELAKEADEDRP